MLRQDGGQAAPRCPQSGLTAAQCCRRDFGISVSSHFASDYRFRLKRPENSQQLLDWYSFSRVVHGIALYFLVWLIAPRTPVLLRLALAVGLEVGWEILARIK